jgi:D-alanyl-D-alanine carboxypeptidase/D-alanyl-D-alanine-endopeptidase (penicillin-binding protein 4)
VNRVSGRFLYDDSAVVHRDAIEARQPTDASYNPGLAGLSLDFNRFKVRWNEGTPIGAEVPLDPLPVALTAPPEQNEVWVPVREPGRFTARMFHWMAAKQNVTLPLPQPGHAPPEASELVRNESLPVAEILRRALIYSNNMTTETLLIAAAQKALGHAVRLEEAGDWLAARTKEALPAQTWTGLVTPNGSGLTDAARITPAQCAATARRAGANPATRAVLPPLQLEPFAVADSRAQPNTPLRAKTGTIFYARALGGTVRTKSGRDVAFCILTDDHVQRALYDAIPFDKRKDDVNHLPAREWLRAAREIEKAAVLGWVENL